MEINLHIPSTQSSKVTHKDAKMHFKGVKVRDIHKISLTLCMLFLAFPRSKYIYGNNIRKSEHYFKEHLKSSSTQSKFMSQNIKMTPVYKFSKFWHITLFLSRKPITLHNIFVVYSMNSYR